MDERLITIDNPHSERIRGVISLGRRSFRLRNGLLRVEGPQAVAELLAWRAESVREVYCTEAAASRYPALWEGSPRRYLVTPEVARAVGPDTQGVFAVCKAEAVVGNVPLDEEAGQTLVVLPATQDPGNAGTIVRTADALGATGILAAKGTADLSGPKVIRTSVGSVFHLPIEQGSSFEQIVADLKRQDITVLGTSGSEDATELDSVDLSGRHAWVFGNEAKGLTSEEEALCDILVNIPMSGNAESMNVATAAGICLFASQNARYRDAHRERPV